MINLHDVSEVSQIITDITSAKNVRRKRNEYISYEVGTGLLRNYVREKIRLMYPQTYDNYTISEYSLLKKVVDKKAKAYKEAPARRLEIESESKDYQAILDDNRFNDAMKEIDKIYNQHKYAGLYFEPRDDEEGKFICYPLRPYEYDLIKDDDGEVECLIISYPGAQVTRGTMELAIAGDRADAELNEVTFSFWTNELHAVYVCEVFKDGTHKIKEKLEIEGNATGINPFGRIPFAHLPFDFNESYPSPSPLANQTIELNSLLSVYLTSANMQVGQLVLSFPADQKIEQVTQGLMTAMSLPQSNRPEDKPSEAKYISPSPDLAGHKDAIVTYLTMILDEQGINSAQVLSGTEKFTSGLDRLLSQADVQSIVEDNQDFYTRFEQECFEIINAFAGNKFKSKKLSTLFKKPKMLTSDTELLANIKTMLELGLIEDYQKFQLVDPNLSDDQAKEKLKRINENKQNTIDKLITMNNGNTNGKPALSQVPQGGKKPAQTP